MTQKPAEAAPEARSGIQVIERMMKLLDVLSYHPDPVSLKQLALETGLHPSTAHRILGAMASSGFVERADPGTYRLGIRLLELGNVVKSRISIGQAAMPLMQRLHRQIGESVNLGVRQGDEIVYIERAVSERSGMQVVRAVGGRAPLHLTSVGKLFLTADEARNVRAYATRTGLAGHTRNSITDIVRLRSMLIEQFCAESGGPCMYSGLSMQESHAGRNIDTAQFNALVEDLIDVMTARRIPVGAQNRLLRRLAPMHGEIVTP